MADSPDEDVRIDDDSNANIDQPKKKRFHAFDRIVHKIFRRKSKRSKYDDDEDDDRRTASASNSRGKSRSTSELAVVECRSRSSSTLLNTPVRKSNNRNISIVTVSGSRQTSLMMNTSSNQSASGLLSLSHDSVFVPDDDDDVESPRKSLHQSRRRFSIKGMKEELMNKLRQRRDQSAAGRRADDGENDDDDDDDDDDDPGLPHSPCSANTSPTTVEVLGRGLLDERARAKKSSKLRSSDNSLLSMGSSETDNEIDCVGGVGLNLMFFDRRQNADPELDLGPTVLLNNRAAHHKIAIKPRRTHAVPRHRRLHQVSAGSSVLPVTPEDAEENFPAAIGSSQSVSTDLFSGTTDIHITNETISVKSSELAAKYVSPGNEDVEMVTTSCFTFGISKTRKARVTSDLEPKGNLSKFLGARLSSRKKRTDDRSQPQDQITGTSASKELKQPISLKKPEVTLSSESPAKSRRHSCSVDTSQDQVFINRHTSRPGITSIVGEAKRKPVQEQLTKQDIDELESFQSSKRQSLPRPLRFSLGSAKDIDNFGSIGDFAPLDSPPVDATTVKKPQSPNPNPALKSSSEDVVKLDCEQQDTNIIGNSIEVVERSHVDLPLRRRKICRNNKDTVDETAELFKVFHRRSLKLKDTDVPVVVSRQPDDIDDTSNEEAVVELRQKENNNGDDFLAMTGDAALLADKNDNFEACGTGNPSELHIMQTPDCSVPDVKSERSSPITEKCSKPSTVTRSSVLDMVRNFQKLQTT